MECYASAALLDLPDEMLLHVISFLRGARAPLAAAHSRLAGLVYYDRVMSVGAAAVPAHARSLFLEERGRLAHHLRNVVPMQRELAGMHKTAIILTIFDRFNVSGHRLFALLHDDDANGPARPDAAAAHPAANVACAPTRILYVCMEMRRRRRREQERERLAQWAIAARMYGMLWGASVLNPDVRICQTRATAFSASEWGISSRIGAAAAAAAARRVQASAQDTYGELGAAEARCARWRAQARAATRAAPPPVPKRQGRAAPRAYALGGSSHHTQHRAGGGGGVGRR